MSDVQSTDADAYKVVVNHEAQYSLWFADQTPPPGWSEVGKVGTKEECAGRMVELLRDPGLRGAFGAAARERIREGFLLPRLVRDELRLFREVLGGGAAAAATAAGGAGAAWARHENP